jgi:hypothetical protein
MHKFIHMKFSDLFKLGGEGGAKYSHYLSLQFRREAITPLSSLFRLTYGLQYSYNSYWTLRARRDVSLNCVQYACNVMWWGTQVIYGGSSLWRWWLLLRHGDECPRGKLSVSCSTFPVRYCDPELHDRVTTVIRMQHKEKKTRRTDDF